MTDERYWQSYNMALRWMRQHASSCDASTSAYCAGKFCLDTFLTESSLKYFPFCAEEMLMETDNVQTMAEFDGEDEIDPEYLKFVQQTLRHRQERAWLTH